MMASEGLFSSVEVKLMALFSFRFPEDPLVIDFTFTRHHAGYDALAIAGDNMFQDLNLQPELLAPPVFINSHLQGQTFYARATISMDNQNVPSGDMSACQFQYQVCNRTFSNAETRRERFGRDYLWPSNTSQIAFTAEVEEEQPDLLNNNTYTPGRPVWRHPNLVHCMDVLTMPARGKTVCTMRAGFDGVWPLSTQNCALAILNKKKNGPSFLRPGLTIDVTLEQRAPLNVCVERAGVADQAYYQTMINPVVLALDGGAYDIRIKRVALVYESMILEDVKEIERINNSIIEYPADVPYFNNNDLAGGIMTQTLQVSLPRGTKFLYLFFNHECQKVANAYENSWMSSKFTFPPNLSEIHLSLVGKEGLLFKSGLVDLDKGNASHSLRMFHAEMRRKNIYTPEFDTWVPKTGKGYDLVLPISLESYHKDLREISNMTVRLNYKAPSQARWSLRSVAVVQRLYCWDAKTKWSWSDKI